MEETSQNRNYEVEDEVEDIWIDQTVANHLPVAPEFTAFGQGVLGERSFFSVFLAFFQ